MSDRDPDPPGAPGTTSADDKDAANANDKEESSPPTVKITVGRVKEEPLDVVAGLDEDIEEAMRRMEEEEEEEGDPPAAAAEGEKEAEGGGEEGDDGGAVGRIRYICFCYYTSLKFGDSTIIRTSNYFE